MMRIITGSARGVRLLTLDGEATRPTSERVKEAVFSMLQFCIAGKEILDPFAGSGQLALEALSRGASVAVMADNSAAAVDIMKKNSEKTRLLNQCTILRSEFTELPHLVRGRKFDIVFLDPPYNRGLIKKSLALLDKNDLLSDCAVVVCECGEAEAAENFGGGVSACGKYEIIKTAKYGIAHIVLLKPRCGAENQEKV